MRAAFVTWRQRLRGDRFASGRFTAHKIALLCIALGLLLRAPFLTAAFNIDEGGDAVVAMHWFSGHGSVYGNYWLDRPPLLLLLYRGALIGGTWGIRFLGCACAAATIWAVVVLTRNVAGDRAAKLAGIMAAIYTSSTILGAVFSDAELLAAAPAAISVLLLVAALQRPERAVRFLAVSGLCAVAALLIKQSFLDALVAGFVFLCVSAVKRRDTGFTWRWIVAWSSAVIAPLVAVVAWATISSVGISHFMFAMLGFRVDGLELLHRTTTPLHNLIHTGLPLLFGTGMGLLLFWAVVELRSLRTRNLVLFATFSAWLAGGFIGMVGGGNWWPHYFIQLIPVLSTLGAIGMTRTSRRWAVRSCLAFVLAAALVFASFGTVMRWVSPPQQSVLQVADFLHANAKPSDTVYVMYARANLVYYSGLSSPFPYNWSLMDEALPTAQPQLQEYLRSTVRRPTWLIEWQSSQAFEMDPFGTLARLVNDHYRLVATVCGRKVFLRRDRPFHPEDVAKFSNCGVTALTQSLLRIGQSMGLVPAKVLRSDDLDYIWS